MAGDDGESAGNAFAFSPVVKPLGSHRLGKNLLSMKIRKREGAQWKNVCCAKLLHGVKRQKTESAGGSHC